jgi:hypothetical protein
MTLTDKLFAYAADFEKTFADDDWTRLERHFTADVVYEVVNVPFACRVEGRDAVLAALRKSISGFDRRCDERRLGIRRGPVESGDEVELDWEVTYVKKGAPDFLLLGGSLARFTADRISYLSDRYPDGMGEQITAWTSAHTPDWDLSYV